MNDSIRVFHINNERVITEVSQTDPLIRMIFKNTLDLDIEDVIDEILSDEEITYNLFKNDKRNINHSFILTNDESITVDDIPEIYDNLILTFHPRNVDECDTIKEYILCIFHQVDNEDDFWDELESSGVDHSQYNIDVIFGDTKRSITIDPI